MGRVLGRLYGESKRGVARNLFPGFHERGLTATAALNELREAGLGYRRSDFLQDYRESSGVFEQATKVRYVNLQRIPTEGILQSRYFGVPDKYSFVYRADGYNADTGDTETRYFFRHRNTLDKRENLEKEAENWFSSDAVGVSGQGFVAEQVRLTEGYINPAWKGDEDE